MQPGRIAAVHASRSRMLYALGALSAADHLATQAGGGEPGVTTGFGVAVLGRCEAIPAATQLLTTNFPAGANAGYHMRIDGTTANTVAIAAYGGGTVSAPSGRLTHSDMGKLNLFVLCVDATHLRQYTHRAQVGAGTAAAASGYVPSTAAQAIGYWTAGGNFAADGLEILGVMSFRGTPTAAQIEALYDATRALGDLPSTMAGATVTHLHSVRRAVRAYAVDGQTSAGVADAITVAPADAMARTGSPKVRVLDPAATGRARRGLIGFVNSAQGLPSAGVGLTNNQPWWCTIYAQPNPGHAGNPYHGYVGWSSDPTNYGAWHLYVTYNNEIAITVAAASGVAALSPGALFTPRAGRLLPMTALWDGAYVRFILDGELLASTPSGSYRARTSGETFAFGRVGSAMPASHMGLFGAAAGESAVTVAEVIAQHAAFAQSGRIASIPNKTHHLWDFNNSIPSTASVPSSIADSIGTDHLPVTGSSLRVTHHTPRLWSYDRTPILYGADTTDVAHHYATSGTAPVVGSASGLFWFSLLLMVTSQQLASATRLPASTINPAGNGGFYFQTLGTNSSFWFTCISTAGSGVASPTSVISASDVGKLLLLQGMHDGTKVRLFNKRAEVGTGSAITGYAPSTAPLNLLRDPRGLFAATGLRVFGAAGGNAVPTLEELYAQHDAVMSGEDIAAIPGKTSFLASFTQDARAAGGLIPPQLTDRIGTSHLAKQGAPTLAAQYARAWGW